MMPPSHLLTEITWVRPNSPGAIVLPTSKEQSAISVQPVPIIAQYDQDVLADIGNGFKNFYESGQLWALLIGLVLGYMIRGLTTYK